MGDFRYPHQQRKEVVEDKTPSCSGAELQLGSFCAGRVRNQKCGTNSLVGTSTRRVSMAWCLLVVLGHLPVQVAGTSSAELITLKAGRRQLAG